mgnify:FL=1
MQKIHREVAKMIHENLFEAALLHWMLKGCQLLRKQEVSMEPVLKELARYDEFTFESQDYSGLFVAVLCNGYYVKSNVNHPDCLRQINADIAEMAPSFIGCYDRWSKHQSLKSLSLQTVNEIFVEHSRTRLD